MTGITKGVLFGLLLSAFFSAGLEAQTINAASCNEGDVSKALSSITTDGTTVVVPAGTCTWTTSLSYTQTNSFTLQGAGAISGTGLQASISGTGSDATIIQDNINRTSGDVPLLGITTISGKSFRLTGFAFTSTTNSTCSSYPSYNGIVPITGYSHSVRIDHNHFNQMCLVGLFIAGWLEGVIDHNQFDSGYPDENQMRFADGNWNNDSLGFGDQSWADYSYWGSSQFMFAENNNFQWVAAIPSNLNANGGFPFDCNQGGRFVFRYNALGQQTAVQTHGTGPLLPGPGGGGRGCRAFEMYNNTANFSQRYGNTTTNFFFAFLDYESGGSLWWGNTFTGFQKIVDADIVRTSTATYTETATPNGWGYCGTTYGPSNWDQNSDSTGRACIDSIGRGKGDLLTGGFPNRVDSVTGTITWPNQVSDPVYMWMNTLNTVSQETNYYWQNYTPAAIVENKDYYLQLPNVNESSAFNGSAGTGSGLLSARPSTCTPYVGYWATDQNTLYQCSASNTWSAYYTPYTYPHPLTTGGPGAPTNLQATVH